jgi:hypothetical protein
MFETGLMTAAEAPREMISTLIGTLFLHFWSVQLAQELGKSGVILFAALQYDYISALPLHKRCNSAQAKSIYCLDSQV